jgi:hypothetical protein
VTVDAPAGLPGITQLNVTFSNGGTSAPASYPATPTATPIVFPTTLSASMPTSRTGSIGVSIDGLDAQGTPIAHGEAGKDLISSGETDITVTLAAVTLVPDAGAGGHGGAIATGGGMAGAGGSAGGGGSAGRDAGRDGTGGAGGTGGNMTITDAGVNAPDAAGTDTRTADASGGAGGTGSAGGTGGNMTVTDAGVNAPDAAGTDTRTADASGGAGGTGSAGGTGGNMTVTDAGMDAPDADGGADAATATTPDGSTATCSPPKSTGGIVCPGNFCTIGMCSGYDFTYTDLTGKSSICMAPNSLCVAGTTGAWNPPAGTVWGVGFGVNLSPFSTPVQLSGTGVTVALTGLPAGVGMTVGVAGYCAVITAATQTIPWTSFNTICSGPATGVALTGAPNTPTIQFNLSSGSTVGTFDFCVTALSFQ